MAKAAVQWRRRVISHPDDKVVGSHLRAGRIHDVMPGLVPGIDVFAGGQGVDGRDVGEGSDAVLRTAMPGHDVVISCLSSCPANAGHPRLPCVLPAALEELHGALVLLGRRARAERAEVPAPSGLRI